MLRRRTPPLYAWGRCLAFASLVLTIWARDQFTDAALEYKVKAAYLFNFTKYISWPTNSAQMTGPIVVGILGNDPFGDVLDKALEGKTVDGRSFVVVRASRPEPIQSASVVFISRSMEPRLVEVLGAFNGKPVVTVSDIERFAPRGGAIGFVIVERYVRFEINRATAERANLKISAKMLKTASMLYSDSPR